MKTETNNSIIDNSIGASATPSSLELTASVGDGTNGISSSSTVQINGAGVSSDHGEVLTMGEYTQESNIHSYIGPDGYAYSENSSVNIAGANMGGSSSLTVDSSGISLSENVTCCNSSCGFELNCCNCDALSSSCSTFFNTVPACFNETLNLVSQVTQTVGTTCAPAVSENCLSFFNGTMQCAQATASVASNACELIGAVLGSLGD